MGEIIPPEEEKVNAAARPDRPSPVGYPGFSRAFPGAFCYHEVRKEASKNMRIRSWGAAAWLVCLLFLLPMHVSAEEGCFPACGPGWQSLADALCSVGAECSYEYRSEIALANGYRDYRGTANQNAALLWLLSHGRLRRPAGSTLLEANLSRVPFLRQERKTCKATAVAMALNLVRGREEYGTADLGGSCCQSIHGQRFTGSDGHTYEAAYRLDGYEGSLEELLGAVNGALDAGLPAVAAVHSLCGGTQHHWVLVLGRCGGDWLIADPAAAGMGSIADNAVSLAGRGYAFGLADGDGMHYGYVVFRPI